MKFQLTFDVSNVNKREKTFAVCARTEIAVFRLKCIKNCPLKREIRLPYRCQYFVDYCAVPNVCRDSQATCKAKNNEVACTCSPLNKGCSLGINQCTINPSVCVDDNKECIELHDELPSWNMEVCKYFLFEVHEQSFFVLKFFAFVRIIAWSPFSLILNG